MGAVSSGSKSAGYEVPTTTDGSSIRGHHSDYPSQTFSATLSV
jgi:hypothetical protein